MQVLGEAAVTKFLARHAAARRPLARFLEIARAAEWPRFPAIKQSFPAADYAPASRTIVFDIGGNKFRLAAIVNFEKGILSIEKILTHGAAILT